MTESQDNTINANLTPLPDKVGVDGLEDKWRGVWDESGVYKFQGTRDRKAVYSIDTPPPTVSGHLHVGHVFSYTHTDVIARFKRMNGYDVFYPMGWDDNGLPTERRVQNYYGVRVDTSLKYDPNFVPPFEGTDGKKIDAKDQVPISRKNFIELCEKLTAQDEKQFEALWRSLGLSIDWSQTYHTIGEHPQRVAQKAFLRNLARGEAYQKDAPGLWDVTFQTAVAQAELESREYPGFYHKVAFRFEDGTPIYIETTRPELLAACGALIAHPDDERYKQYFGQYVYSPLFHVKVPILAHKAAEMDKGAAGIAMCCTFGDVTDVEWWRDLNLPLRSIIQRNGRIVMDTPDWIEDEEGKRIFQETAGKTTFSARKVIVDELRAAGDLDGEPTPTKRMTNFYEKGDKPLEIVTSRQWYLKNGGTDEKLNAELIARGKELNFHPDFMRVRYENWVHGLNGDWLISRQRFFGVPFPLWYPVKEDGTADYDHPITPSEDRLPIDPTDDVPEGYTEDQRDVPGGFTAEPDIMDTWATSSLTPQIVTRWEEPGEENQAIFNATFPMDLRPQGQDIIRTWLFSTMDRAHLENKCLPWSNTTLSGWILDPDHKKMSKSKGNVVVPDKPIKQFGADAVRYWAAAARLGLDATYDEGQMKIGRRLAIKLLNATKFALAIGREDENHHVGAPAVAAWNPADVTEPIDRSAMEEGKRIFQETAGKTTFSRKGHRRRARAAGDLDGEPTPTKRMTNFYEKAHRPGREAVRGAVALPRPVHRLVADLPHHRRASAARGPEGVPAQPGPWRSVSEGRSGSVGRDVPDRSGPGRTGIARISGLLPQGGVPFRRRHPDLHRDHPSGTAGRLRRADRASGRRALQAVFRPVRLLPAVPCEGADSGA